MEFKTLKISPKTAVLESVRAQTKLFRYVRDNNLESAKANLNHPIHGPIIKEYLRIIPVSYTHLTLPTTPYV